MSSMLYFEVSILGLLTAAVVWFYRKVTYWDRAGVPNTGFLFQFLAYRNRQGGEVEIEVREKYGPIFGSYLFLSPILVVGTESHMNDIMIKDFSTFRNHTTFPTPDKRMALNPLWQRNEYWKKLRGVITSTFTSGRLRSMAGDAMLPCIDTFITNMTKLSKESCSGSAISVKRYFECLLMDIIMSCAYGVKIDCLNDPNNEMVVQASKIFKAFGDSFGIFGSLFVDKSCFDYISKLTVDLVAQRRKENLEGVKGRTDFLQVLTDAKYDETLSDDEICGLGIAFFDGYETTSTTLTALVYFLAKYPDIQNKLHEEVQQIRNDVNYDTVTPLVYLDAVIKEALRMWPPGYRIDRLCEKEYTLEGTNIKIPAGMSVHIPLYAFHHDPKIYTEPKEFKPERYITSERNPTPPPFLTFGAGPRNCVAQRFATINLKITVAKLVNQLKFEATPDTKLESVEGEKILMFTKDVYLKIVPRTLG